MAITESNAGRYFSLALQRVQSSVCRAPECVLPVAWPSIIGRGVLA